MTVRWRRPGFSRLLWTLGFSARLVDADFNVAHLDLERRGEVSQNRGCLLELLSRSNLQVKAVENLAELRHQKLRKNPSFRRFYLDCAEPFFLGSAMKSIQQNRFSGAAETDDLQWFIGSLHISGCDVSKVVVWRDHSDPIPNHLWKML